MVKGSLCFDFIAKASGHPSHPFLQLKIKDKMTEMYNNFLLSHDTPIITTCLCG